MTAAAARTTATRTPIVAARFSSLVGSMGPVARLGDATTLVIGLLGLLFLHVCVDTGGDLTGNLEIGNLDWTVWRNVG